MFDRLEIENLPENPYQSLNSFLFELNEDIPEKGKIYEYFTIDEIIDDEGNLIQHKINMIFTVTKMENHRIKKVHLKIVYLSEDDKSSDDKNEKTEQKDGE